MLVFDDSSPANHEKYYSTLERTTTHNELYSLGPAEQEQLLSYPQIRVNNQRQLAA
jgi:hypothetical protein